VPEHTRTGGTILCAYDTQAASLAAYGSQAASLIVKPITNLARRLATFTRRLATFNSSYIRPDTVIKTYLIGYRFLPRRELDH
jgi:hypothetical protein